MADSQRKTANLFDVNSKNTANGYVNDAQLISNGNTATWGSAEVSEYIPIKGNTEYTFNGIGSYNTAAYCLYDSDKQYISGQTYNGRSIITFTSPDNARFVRFTHIKVYRSAMFVEGSYTTSTMPVFEPYWQHSLRKLGTSTDTLTTLPADIYADGNNATVGISGNTVQNGTPTPTTPIQPQETGERTGNLADLYNANVSQVGLTFSATDNMRIVINGTKTDGVNIVPIKRPNIILPAGTYTVKIKMVSGEITGLTSDGIMFGINASTYGQRTSVVTKVGEIGKRTFTLSEDTTISSFDITPSYSSIGAIFDNATFECWLYAGSDDKPYEPYGYKIPISSANTTTPVYLGEVQSTRRIKKLVLTGEEGWVRTQNQKCYYINASTGCPTDYLKQTITTSICSHYQSQNNTASGSNVVEAGHFCFYTGGGFELYIGETTISSAADFKSYLAQQYANGTPVTVWYALATPTTAAVNEPIRKIGDYADTVSGITIPTITGKDTFDVLTTLKPSEVELTYTGWHDSSVKEWDGSQWQ